jgi:phospholipid transport system substrate-binding protein
MKRRSQFILLTFSIIIIFSTLVPVNIDAADSGPTFQLQSSVDKLFKVLQDETLKGVEKSELRHERIAEVVFMQFDMRRMAKLSLGRGWRNLNEAERDHFVDLFRKLLAKSYVATIDGYSGERLSYIKEIIRGNKAEVRTLVIGNGKEIPLSYKLKLNNSRWLIYDVIIENVSLVRNYRSQFDPIMKKEGFAGLVKRLEKKIASAGAKKNG